MHYCNLDTEMVNFMCQLGWCPGIWSNSNLDVSVKMFLNETII